MVFPSESLYAQLHSIGSAGPLIPRIQKVYHVGFAVVSLIFVFACVVSVVDGRSFIGCPLIFSLGIHWRRYDQRASHRPTRLWQNDHLGFDLFYSSFSFFLLNAAAGSVFQMIAYALQAPAPPFPVFVLSFVINGVGLAIQV